MPRGVRKFQTASAFSLWNFQGKGLLRLRAPGGRPLWWPVDGKQQSSTVGTEAKGIARQSLSGAQQWDEMITSQAARSHRVRTLCGSLLGYLLPTWLTEVNQLARLYI